MFGECKNSSHSNDVHIDVEMLFFINEAAYLSANTGNLSDSGQSLLIKIKAPLFKRNLN